MQAAQQAVLRVKGVGENRGRGGGNALLCVLSRRVDEKGTGTAGGAVSIRKNSLAAVSTGACAWCVRVNFGYGRHERTRRPSFCLVLVVFFY